MSKEQEYREIFLGEAQESYEQLNQLFTELEKDISNKKAIDAIFRITHTLKGNAMGMGYVEIAELGHAMEDVFNEVKTGKIVLDTDIFSSLYRANDVLGELIEAVQTPKPVKFKGIKTKLEVILKNSRKDAVDNKETGVAEAAVADVPSLSEVSEKSADLDKMNTSVDAQAIAQEIEEEFVLSKISMSDVVQVPIRKLDSLLNIVGELLIEKDTLIARHVDNGSKASDFARLHRITSDLQYGIMDVRLVQVGFLFNKFHRVLRDVATIEHKKVDLVLEGTEIEIDRNIIKTMSDSLVHMVRNSVSHGIESPENRQAAGKNPTGKVTLRARNEKDTVFIEIEDDGAGIDVNVIKRKAIEKGIIPKQLADTVTEHDILMCIFEPGFSNAEKITEVSGRGVGMDVVRRATESIGGKIAIFTEVGKGTKFVLSLPSSMAVKGALLFELASKEYAIALAYTEAVISVKKKDIHKISNGLISTYLSNTISVIFLKDLFGLESLRGVSKEGAFHESFDHLDDDAKLDLVIVTYSNKVVGFVVDKLLQQKEIVEKNLPNPVDRNELFSGATILGNGNVCLVIDVVSVLNSLFKEKVNLKTT